MTSKWFMPHASTTMKASSSPGLALLPSARSAASEKEEMPEAALQIDHRVPFEVAGESETMAPEDFMLLCGSANRAKSWSCEHCENWNHAKKREVCLTCYWAYPESHTHVAMQQPRRVDLLWQGSDTAQYERLKADAAEAGLAIPDFVKDVLRKALRGES